MEDNNAFGMAMVMVVPLLVFLVETALKRQHKLVLMGCTAFLLIAILLTYSRGAFLGLSIMGAFWWWTSRRRVTLAIVLAVTVAAAVPFIPANWFDRMDTLREYESEGSAASRLVYWQQGFNMGLGSPIFGHGFKSFLQVGIVRTYRAPEHASFTKLQEAHSIYFQMLGEQGFVGLGIFLALIATALFTLRRTVRRTKDIAELFWANRLARAMFLSIIAYSISGTFLSLAYFDLFYLFVAMAICLDNMVRRGEQHLLKDSFVGLLASTGLLRLVPLAGPTVAATPPAAPRPSGPAAGPAGTWQR
jgi:probable O-glycosylation ligase (exosortase A-associated)